MEVPKKVKSDTTRGYLTCGKEYEIYGFSIWGWSDDYHVGEFFIKDDNGNECFCLIKRCDHILNNDWELIY